MPPLPGPCEAGPAEGTGSWWMTSDPVGVLRS